MFISAIAFQKNSVLLLGKKVGRNFWQPSVEGAELGDVDDIELPPSPLLPQSQN